jgi:predicted transcriptional regulator
MAQDIEAELTSSLAKQLIVIDSEIDHESVSEYISSICLEETMDDEEKVEGIREFLEEATTESIDSFMDEITSQLSLISLDRSKKVEAAKELEVIKSREAETNALKVDAIVEAVEVKVLSKEDRERREALLRQYEFVEESFEDVEGGGDADDAGL